MRGAAVAGLAVLVAAAGVVGLVAFLQGRDEAGIGDAAPGVPASDAPAAVADGSVVLEAADPAALAPLREEYAAPAGPTVRVRRAAGARGVTAWARGRRLDAAGPDDPALRGFIEYWLGR